MTHIYPLIFIGLFRPIQNKFYPSAFYCDTPNGLSGTFKRIEEVQRFFLNLCLCHVSRLNGPLCSNCSRIHVG
ncbi:hypothetical protein CDZ95_20315 [Mameliella alba]|nr:hypothetical protein CDZ95_20315 [Mameliella alba]